MTRRTTGSPRSLGSVAGMRAPIQLDLHLPNFNFPGVGPEAVFDRLADIATRPSGGLQLADADGPLPPDPAGRPAAELDVRGQHDARRHRRADQTIALGLLVGGVTYRNPAQHAKITTTLDVISGGRAIHGIGAGWFEAEHDAYGFAFPPLKERFERLEDHLRIVRAMFTEEQATVAGTHHSVTGAYNNPKPLRGDIPILVGGSGERKTLRMVAQYADGCNLFGDPERAQHLLGVLHAPLRERRARSGRDHEDVDDVDRDRRDRGRRPGQARRDARGGIPRAADRRHDGRHARADPRARARVPRRRHRGLTFSMPDVHDLEAVTLAGKTLAPVFNPEPRPGA